LDISSLVTNPFFIKSMYSIAFILTGALFIATLGSVFYQRYFYKKFIRPGLDKNYKPRCSIILPCKGVPKDLDKNLQAYCDLDYPDYELLVTVESENDPAVPVVQSVVENNDNIQLVIAGYTKHCAQKNHNMLAAIKKATNPEVYIFADADIAPKTEWLEELILPLSDGKLTATTGFRWLVPEKADFGHLTHSNVNIFFLVLFGLASLLRVGSICWGGAMAIRKKDFDALGVAQKWARSGVDDISLSRVLFDNGKRSILVPASVTPTDDVIDTAKGTITWCARQIMFLKVYHRALYVLAVGGLWFMALLLYLLLPFSIVYSYISESSFLTSAGGASLVFIFGDTLITLLYPLYGPIPQYYKLFILQPFLRFTHILAYGKTLWSRRIVWSGIRYTMNFTGDVTKVERLG